MSLRRATTVLLLRQAASDLQVFMVKRNRKMGFLPNAWVFPGGRVDDADHLEAGHPGLIGEANPQIPLEHVIAGVRETFEEGGVWLGENAPGHHQRDALNSNQTTIVDVLNAGATIDLGALVPFAWWVTPKEEKKRYDTWFLAIHAPNAEGVHDEKESVDSRWISVREAIAQPQREFALAPPTWWTLKQLASLGSVQQVINSAKSWKIRPIEPVMVFRPEGFSVVLPGHVDHGEEAAPGYPHQISFQDDHWIAHPDEM